MGLASDKTIIHHNVHYPGISYLQIFTVTVFLGHNAVISSLSCFVWKLLGNIFDIVFFFCSGFVAEHMDLRHFLTLGMLSSGLMSVFFGLGYFWNFHKFAYFVTIQVLIVQ